MNLKTLESQIDNVILQRGQSYTAFVDNLEETEPDFWQAWVQGSDDYDIEITLKGDEVTQWSCTCPYEFGPVCKHVAATLLVLRKQRSAVSAKGKIKKKRLTKQQQRDQVLAKLTRDELEQVLRDLLGNDRRLTEHFLLRFQHHTDGGEPLEKRYRTLFDNIVRNYSDHGYIEYRDAHGFYKEVEDLLENLSSVHNPPQAQVRSCFVIIHGLLEVVNGIDDSDGYLGDLMYSVRRVLEAVYPKLSAAEQRNCLQELLTLELDGELSDYGLDEPIADLVMEWATAQTDYQELYLSSLDQVIKSSREWRKDNLLRRKYQLLLDWRQADAAETLAQQYITMPEFREQFVQRAIDQKDYAKARQLINEGIVLAEEKQHPGTVRRWREMLLVIAKKTDDRPAIRSELLQLMMTDRFSDLTLYKQYKATYPAAEWEQVRQDVYQTIKEKGVDAHTLASILDEENELAALFDLIFDRNLYSLYGADALFKKYAKRLSVRFPQEVVDKQIARIQSAIRHTGRPVYENVASELKDLASFPGGEEPMQTLLAEFRQKYTNRPAMLEVFAREFGKAS